jgi:hypothetical protein
VEGGKSAVAKLLNARVPALVILAVPALAVSTILKS